MDEEGEPEDRNEELRILGGWLLKAGIAALLIFIFLGFVVFIALGLSFKK